MNEVIQYSSTAIGAMAASFSPATDSLTLNAITNYIDYCLILSDNEGSFKSNDDIRIFPNPFNLGIKIQLNIYGKIKIGIFDLLGREWKRYEFESSNTFLHLSELPAGLYIIQLYIEDKTIYSGILSH